MLFISMYVGGSPLVRFNAFSINSPMIFKGTPPPMAIAIPSQILPAADIAALFLPDEATVTPSGMSSWNAQMGRGDMISILLIWLFAFLYPAVCGSNPSASCPMRLLYVRRLPKMPSSVLRNRPWSLSLRSLNRNACSSRYRNK